MMKFNKSFYNAWFPGEYYNPNLRFAWFQDVLDRYDLGDKATNQHVPPTFIDALNIDLENYDED